MDEITLDEVLTHYISRIHIIKEYIEKQKTDMNQLIDLLDDQFDGSLKLILNDKLEESIVDTQEINDSLEDILYFLKKQLNEVEESIHGNYSLFE